MPSLSHHISALQPSATLAINSMARQLRAQGHKIWNFSVGEPDYPPPHGVIWATAHSLYTDSIRYGTAGGGIALRTTIQHKLKVENQFEVDLDQIVCGVGAKQVLHHLFHVLIDPGDEVALHRPYWTSYRQQIASAHGVTVEIPYHRDDGGCPYDPDYLDTFIGAKTKIFLLCSPNNPTGHMLQQQSLTKLAQYLSGKDIWVISDEIYEYITFDEPHRSLYNVCADLKDRYIHVNGISKSFAMTGWRMGYVAAPQPVAQLVKTLISHSSTSLPIFVEKAAAWAIERGASLMATEIKELKSKRDRAITMFKQLESVSWIEPKGAFYLFVDLRQHLQISGRYLTHAGSRDNTAHQHSYDTLQLSMDLLNTHHITVVAGEAFGCPGFIRISYATSLEDLDTGLSQLINFLQEL